MARPSLELTETMITNEGVALRLADHLHPMDAKFWVDIRVPASELAKPTDHRPAVAVAGNVLLTDIQLAALGYVRDLIDGEMARLKALAGQKR